MAGMAAAPVLSAFVIKFVACAENQTTVSVASSRRLHDAVTDNELLTDKRIMQTTVYANIMQTSSNIIRDHQIAPTSIKSHHIRMDDVVY